MRHFESRAENVFISFAAPYSIVFASFEVFNRGHMYYLGQFSFLEEHENKERYYGFFNCIVEADSIEKAIGLFGNHIRKTRKLDDIFHGIMNIFLNHVIEIEQVPKGGIITNYISIYGEMPPMLRCGQFKKTTGVHCYGLTAAGGVPKECGTESTEEPFLKFE